MTIIHHIKYCLHHFCNIVIISAFLQMSRHLSFYHPFILLVFQSMRWDIFGKKHEAGLRWKLNYLFKMLKDFFV